MLDINNMKIEDDDPWSGILTATMFAMRSTVHTTSQYTPSQLVFGRDSILNISHEANWKLLQPRKQRPIRQNSIRQNRKTVPYTYNIANKVIIK